MMKKGREIMGHSSDDDQKPSFKQSKENSIAVIGVTETIV